MAQFRKWTHLFLSNYLGVFNDNFLKNSIIFVALGWQLPAWLNESQLISIVSSCLVLPYLIFSPYGGRLAAIHKKKKVFVVFKLLEIPVLILAAVAFYFQWIYIAILSVLIMGILSSMYSPSKYGLIRDIGGKEGVSYGSGGFEMMAFLGILTGTIVASVISDTYSDQLFSAVLMVVAVLGYIVTKKIEVTEQPVELTDDLKTDPFRFVVATFRFARQHRFVNSSVLGAASFWLIGSMVQMNLIIHSACVYHASNTQTGLIMGCAALGIAAGTYVAGVISGKQVKKGLILPGLAGMILMLALLTFVHLNWYLYIVVVFVTTFSGGLFQIPNLSVIQQTDLGRKAGDVFAYLNIVTFVLILLGAVLFSLTTKLTNQNSYAVFGVIALVSMAVGVYFLLVSPDYRNETTKLLKS